jgi:steroid delta-isomerase-like uncharacterized protein
MKSPPRRCRSTVLLATIAMSSLSAGAEPGAPTTAAADIRRNEALGRRYFEEAWNRGDLDVLEQVLAPSYINHTPSTPNPPAGPEGLKPIIRALRAAFPDLHYEIKDVLATKDAVVMRVLMTGTHRGDLFGVPATGRKVSVNQINIEHIANGKIVEHWRVTDELTLMRQLGVVK